jgi:hypothetical protein
MPDVCADFESLRRVVHATGWARIGIDGVDGSGKSHLAEALAEAIGYPTLNLDDYLFQNQGGFVPFVDYPALSAALTSMPKFILSGVCLREVLANSSLTLDGHIYIKRMRQGLWADEDECVFPDGVDAAIETLARYSAMLSHSLDERSDMASQEADETQPALSEEIMRYHEQYQPQDVADIVYEMSNHVG